MRGHSLPVSALTALLLAAQAVGCGASKPQADDPVRAQATSHAPASTLPGAASPASPGSASPASPSPASASQASPSAARAEGRPPLGQATAATAQLFLSSVPLYISGGAGLVARAALGDGAAAAERSLSFDFLVTLPDGAKFPLLAKRLPSAHVESSHMKLPFRIPVAKPAARAVSATIAPSFVIDYDSARFAPFATAFDGKLGATKDVLAIEKFVADYISKKSFGRPFDIASEVANSRAGDCTEHAVLLTAALRRRGIPSRVTLGVLFVFGAESAAFGHAWVEAEQHGETVRLDAALRGVASPERLLHYYPLAQLADEGPGFSRATLREPGVIHVQSVTLALNGG